LTTQEYFKELVSLDVRKRLFEEKLRKLEDELTPFGFFGGDDDSMEEASKELAREREVAERTRRRDRSWMDDADEIL
jgi:hypothetical protein